jgi:transcriptional regulator with XRE-family HTH domain
MKTYKPDEMASSRAARDFLIKRGYTPKTLAAALNVSTKVAKRILYGSGPLWSNDVILICDKLNVQLDLLCGYESALQYKPCVECAQDSGAGCTPRAGTGEAGMNRKPLYLSDLNEDEKRLILALRNPDDEIIQRLKELECSDSPDISKIAVLCLGLITENQKLKAARV